MLSELKTKQFNNFQSFMKAALEVAASGGEVDMTQTKMVYGRIYFLKYRELVNETGVTADTVSDEVDTQDDSEVVVQEQAEEQLPQKEVDESQEDVADTASSEAEDATGYDAMSDDQLRDLAKEAKLKGAHNMKRENLIAKLKESA